MAEPFNPLQVVDPNADGNPLYAGSPTLADVWRFNANATQDWLDQQRAISAQRGLWNPETGLPTQVGLIDAAQQYGSGVMMGTTAPGARGATMDNPAFAKWFGQSQAVDKAGKPLVLYHGTNRQFGEFKTQPAMRMEYGSPVETQSQAHFFTADRDTARDFAYNKSQVDSQMRGKSPGRKNIGDYHLSVREPLDFTGDDLFPGTDISESAGDVIYDIAGYRPHTWQEVQAALDDPHVIAGLKDYGYDGARLMEDNGAESWAVFDPTQVKSASKNRGTFDPNDPRFKYGVAGLMAGAGGVAAASQAQASPTTPPASTPWHSRWNDVLQRYGYSTIPTP